uniref:Uncharacterized protein n=1 Tax=Brassica oleracea var. oleracea TaxID=109376 RepID=A0A0D3CFC7_BRAOL
MFPRTVPSEISEEIPTNSPRKRFFGMSSESLILGYVLHMVVHAYHSNIIKIFITHGLQKIGEVQGTFSNVQIRGRFIISGRRILFHCRTVDNHSSFRVRKFGSSTFYTAKVESSVYDYGLATLVVDCDVFWEHTHPLELHDDVPSIGETVSILAYGLMKRSLVVKHQKRIKKILCGGKRPMRAKMELIGYFGAWTGCSYKVKDILYHEPGLNEGLIHGSL